MTDKTYFHDLANDTPTRTPTFRLYTTDGIHSGKTNLAGNPCELEARATMYVEDRGGAGNSVDFKFRNVATGATSSTQTVTISPSATDTVTLVFGDLPLRNASGLQEYELLVGCGSSAITLRLQTLVIAETRESSQPESKGSNLYNSSAATTRV
jgi:hypothetical protein